MSCAGASAAVSKMIDVAAFGATPNDDADDAAGIARAIAASRTADTIRFPPGRYMIASTVRLAGERTYRGRGATLVNAAGRAMPVFAISDASALSISGFTFSGGGLKLDGGKTVSVQANTFRDIFDPAAPFGAETGIFLSRPVTGLWIRNNRFERIGRKGQRIGTEAATGILAFDVSSAEIAGNTFVDVHQGMSLNFETSRRDIRVTRNKMTGVYRMGIEAHVPSDRPGGGRDVQITGFVTADNTVSFSQRGSEHIGLSIVLNHSVGAAVTGNTVTTRHGRPCKGMGIEIGGVATVVARNRAEGDWCTGVGVYADRVQFAIVTANTVCGPKGKHPRIWYYNGRRRSVDQGGHRFQDTCR
ncbi:MAG: right-handed parallel beta-helix repeat-containing protein [Pseudomonadota bacterium]